MTSSSASLVLSLTTLLLVLVACEGRPNPPDFISSFTSPTSIRVEWNPPSLDPGAVVTGFRLQYKLGNGGKMIKIKLDAEYSYDIEGLEEPCGDYRLRMSTASSKGLSRYSSFSEVERVQSAPQNVNVVPASSSARITWSPPSNSFCMSGYQLQYGPNENELQSMELPAELTQYLLSDLQPGTSYLMTLAALANEQMSEEAYLQWYQAGSPIAPSNLKASPSSTQSAIVMWSPASSGMVTRYEYLYGLVDTPDTKLTSGYVGSSTTLVELDNLVPGEEYIMKVTSVNSIGQSEATVVMWTQPAPAPVEPPRKPVPAAPSQITVEVTSAQTVRVSWTRPEGDAEIGGYIIGFGLAGSDPNELTLFSIGPDDLSEELEGLKPEVEYMVNIQAYNDVGDGQIQSTEWRQEAPTVPISVPPLPQGVLTYSSSPASIMVRWMLLDNEAAGQTDGFRVTYGRNQEANEFTVEVGPQDDAVELQDLQPDTFYYMKVYKFNRAGQSPSVSRSLQTLSPPPEERCAQQQQCVEQFDESHTLGAGPVCPRILQYLNCLQRLQDACMAGAGYRRQVARARNMYLREGCNRNPTRTETGPQRPPVPEGFAVTPSEFIMREVIPPPVNLTATYLSPTSARLSWVDETLGDSQVVTDNRFYNIRYRSPLDQDYLEERTRDTSFLADFLLPGVQYVFEVQLVLDPQRRSELSMPVTVLSRDPSQGTVPQRFAVTQVTVSGPTTAKAVLNWLPPPERKGVTEYTIEYTDSEEFRDPATVWDRLTVDGSKMTTILDGLMIDTEYHVRITANFGPGEAGPTLATPTAFTTPVVPPSSKTTKQCGESELDAVTRRVDFLWDGVADGVQRPPLFGIPIPYCEDEFGVEECHGLFCFCVPGKKPPALREPECTTDVPPCRREYNTARQALDEARQTGVPAMAAQLPHCRDDGYYHPKQCSGTMCYCVTQAGAHTGREAPIWEANGLRCE